MKNSCTIYGTKGTINIPSPWLPPIKSYMEIFINNSYYKNFISAKKNIYAIQIESFSNLFIKNEKKQLSQVNINESVEILTNLDKWKTSLI